MHITATFHVDDQAILRFPDDLVRSLPEANVHKQKGAVGRILWVALQFIFVAVEYFNIGWNTHLVVLHLVNHDIGIRCQAPIHYIKESTPYPHHSLPLAWLSRRGKAVCNDQSAVSAIQSALPFQALFPTHHHHHTVSASEFMYRLRSSGYT